MIRRHRCQPSKLGQCLNQNDDFIIDFESALGQPATPLLADDDFLSPIASGTGLDASHPQPPQWDAQTNQVIDLASQRIGRPLTGYEQAEVAMLLDPNLGCTPEPALGNNAGLNNLNDPNETYISQGPSATELGAQRRQTEQTRGALGAILAGPIAIPGTVAATSASTVLLSGPAALSLRANVLIGSGVNGTLNVVGQLQADGQIRFSEVVIATGFGAVAGPLAAHSNWAGVMLVGGATNAGQTAVTNYVFPGNNGSVSDAAVFGAILAPFGQLTGRFTDRFLQEFASNPSAASATFRAVTSQSLDATVSNLSTLFRQPTNTNQP